MHLGNRPKLTTDANQMHSEIVTANVVRIEVRKNQLAVRLKRPNAEAAMGRDQGGGVDPTGSKNDESGSLLLIPWCKPP